MVSLSQVSHFCNTWVEKCLALLGLSMAAAIMLQVFCRYVLNNSLFWSEELARCLLIWLTFLGASSAYHRGIHPCIDIVTQRMTAPLRKFCNICVHMVSMVFFLVMIYHGIAFTYFIRAQISPAMGIPKWIIVCVIPISGCLFLLHCLVFFIADLQVKHRDG